MGIVCSAIFRTYSVLHSLLATGVPGKRLILVRPQMEHNTSQLYHEQRTGIDPALPDVSKNSGSANETHSTCHHSTDAVMVETHTNTARPPFNPFDEEAALHAAEDALREAGVHTEDGDVERVCVQR